MASRISQWTLDVDDIDLMSKFWSAVLGYRISKGDGGSAKLYPPSDAPANALTVWLQGTAGPKRGKNRDHPDLNVTDGTVDDEADRLIGLGARRVDVGQKDTDPFVVLADPEGNEFCLLRNEPHGS